MAFTAQFDVDVTLIRAIRGSDVVNPTLLDQEIVLRTHAGILQPVLQGAGLGNASAARLGELHLLQPRFRDGTTPFGRLALADTGSKTTPLTYGGNSFVSVEFINAEDDTSGSKPFITVPSTAGPSVADPDANTTVVSGDNATNTATARIGGETAVQESVITNTVDSPFRSKDGFRGATFTLDSGTVNLRDPGLYQFHATIEYTTVPPAASANMYVGLQRVSDLKVVAANSRAVHGLTPISRYRLSAIVPVVTANSQYRVLVSQNTGASVDVDKCALTASKVCSFDPNPLVG